MKKRKRVVTEKDWDDEMFQIAVISVLTAIKNELDRRNEMSHDPR